LKIIQVFNRYLKPGGEEKSVARIAEDLESGGHAVTRFWRESSEWQGAGRPPKWKQPFLLWNNREALEALRREQAAVRAVVWVLHNVVPVVSLGVYSLARELGVPVIQWLHNYRPVSPSGALFAGAESLEPDDPWISWKEIRAGSWNGRLATAFLVMGYRRLRRNGAFASVRAWVAVSEEMRRLFERAAWYPDRLFTLRHSWHAAPAPSAMVDEGYFLFLGRMVETKGVRFLVDLWKDPALRDIKLVMAGDGPLRDELSRNSLPNVEWVGHVEGEVKKKLKAGCRAILFPSCWAEPLSTVAYEAYEMKKPIVASNLGGMPEIVRDGETGFLLAPGQLEQWRSLVLRLSRGRDEATRLGEQGRAWLEREVTPARWVEQFNAIAHRAGCVHSS
jgi:glycosyltransferase involved in cell wall biosynthesis